MEALVKDINSVYPTIDILINNAGAFIPNYTPSAQDLELTMAGNHLAPFYLTGLLLPSLKSKENQGLPRVINVASMAHERVDPLEKYFGDLFCEQSQNIAEYDHMQQYARSKLANIHFTRGLAKFDSASGKI